MERSMNLEKITLGTCYYPEHWPEGMWEEDLRRMLENGIEVVRVAEFAWSKIEPRDCLFYTSIRAVVLENLVLENLKQTVTFALENEQEFVRRLMNRYAKEQQKQIQYMKRCV